MAGMPWEDYAGASTDQVIDQVETGPWTDFKSAEPAQPEEAPWQAFQGQDGTLSQKPLNLSSDQTLVGGFSQGGPSFAASTDIDRSDKGIKAWMEQQEQQQREASPYFDKESGIDFSSPLSALKTLPVVRDLKNPWSLWGTESMPARLKSAYDKGVFDKPVGELVQNAADDVKDIKLSQIWDAAKKNPAKFGAEFINATMADPYLLLAPIGLGGTVVKNLERLGTAGKAAGTAIETGVMAGAISAPIDIAKQLDEQGFVDPSQLAQSMGINATAGAAFGAVLGLAGQGKAPGNRPSDIATTMQFNMQEGDDIMTALNKAMEAHEVPPKQAEDLTTALEKAMVEKPEAWQDFTQLQALDDKPLSFKEMTENLMSARKTGEVNQGEFESLMGSIDTTGLASIGNMAKAMTDNLYDGLFKALSEGKTKYSGVNDPILKRASQAYKEGKIQSPEDLRAFEEGKTKAYAEEPSSLAAQLDNLSKQKFLTPSQASKYQDIKTYLEVLPEVGVDPRTAGNLTERQVKAAIDERLPSASLETIVKAKTPELLADNFKTVPDAFKQRGVLDPEMAKYLALVGGGAVAGGLFADDKPKGMAIGAALALGGAIGLRAGKSIVKEYSDVLADPVEAIFDKKGIRPKVFERPKETDITEFHSGGEPLHKAAKDFYNSFKRDKDVARQTDEMLSRHERIIAGTGLSSERLGYAIEKLVPDLAARERIFYAIDDGKVPELQGNERIAAELFQKEMAEAGDYAQKAGVIEKLIEDGSYVSHIFEKPEQGKNYYSSVSPKSRFAEDRLIPSARQAEELGYKLKTKDIAEIAKIYGKSIGKSIANKDLLETLKTGKFRDNLPMVGKQGEVPTDYVQIDHPQLRDLRVHPELAPSLSHVFYSQNIPAYLKFMMAVSNVTKRGIFSLSAFHIKSLGEAAVGNAFGNVSKEVFERIPSMYKMIKEGKAGDFADQMTQAGMALDAHADLDLNNDFFRNMLVKGSEKLEQLPVGKSLSLPLKGLDKVDRALQFTTFKWLHPSLKLSTASVLYEKALIKQGELLNKNPNAIVKSPQELQRDIAMVMNDTYGGLNWRRLTDEIENKWLHAFTSSLTNPAGRRWLQVALLAPDWTFATFRSGYKGLKSTAKMFVPGVKLTDQEKMYARYFIGSSIAYAALADPINYAFSGHHFWENEDPTRIDLGDGRTVQGAKHYMEIFHFLGHPAQVGINKMGYLPKEALNQLAGTEYFAPYLDAQGRVIAGPAMENPSIPGRVWHAVKGAAPITFQQDSLGKAASGFAGAPIYGKTKQERERERREKSRDPATIRAKRERERARRLKRDNRG